jgi:DNA-binding NtrC family response regulator
MRITHEPLEDCVAQQLVGHSLKEVEQALILETLRDLDGNRTRAATVLGISVRCLRDKIRQLREQGTDVPVSRPFELNPGECASQPLER